MLCDPRILEFYFVRVSQDMTGAAVYKIIIYKVPSNCDATAGDWGLGSGFSVHSGHVSISIRLMKQHVTNPAHCSKIL